MEMNFQKSITIILNTRFNVSFHVHDNLVDPFCSDVDTREVVFYCRNSKKYLESKTKIPYAYFDFANKNVS